MTYKTLAECREMRRLLIEQKLELANAINEVNYMKYAVQCLTDKISDIDALLDDLEDQETELCGFPDWMNWNGKLDGWDGTFESLDKMLKKGVA